MSSMHGPAGHPSCSLGRRQVGSCGSAAMMPRNRSPLDAVRSVLVRVITYESAAAHDSRTSSGSHFSAPCGRRDSGVGGPGSHARPSAAFECYLANARELAMWITLKGMTATTFSGPTLPLPTESPKPPLSSLPPGRAEPASRHASPGMVFLPQRSRPMCLCMWRWQRNLAPGKGLPQAITE